MDDIANDEFLCKIIFTDECVFRSDGSINRHNEHHYAVENPHCRKTTHVQGRFSVNVWAGILGDRVIGPHFIEGRVDGPSYARFLEERLPELLNDLPQQVREEMIFQQDGHPAHYSRVARAVLDREYPQRWIGLYGPREWPPRSPDLTPCDFFLWGFVKDKVYRNGLPEDENDLRQQITQAFQEITPQMLRNVRENFMKRVGRCVDENGGIFEHLL